jgi:hypothetical protein
MQARHAMKGLLAIWVITLPATVFAQAATLEARPVQSLSLTVGTTAAVGSFPTVEPLPGLAAGLLFEHRWFGAEAGAAVVPLARCSDFFEGVDQDCGAVWTFHAAVRGTLMPGSRWSPYLSARVDLVDARKAAFGLLNYVSRTERILVPAAGPRLGVRYRAEQGGFFIEAGPSFMSSDRYTQCSICLPPENPPAWWIVQASTGFSWSWAL